MVIFYQSRQESLPGYLKLWFPESENSQRLEQLRQIIADRALLRSMYDVIYTEEISKNESK